MGRACATPEQVSTTPGWKDTMNFFLGLVVGIVIGFLVGVLAMFALIRFAEADVSRRLFGRGPNSGDPD